MQTKFICYVILFESTKESMFPDINLPDRLFNGIPFKELPICHIRVSKNNTIVSFTDYHGKLMLINSCGIEGYKNCRKGTNIAGQATAITACGVSESRRRSFRAYET